MKLCNGCGTWLELSSFSIDRASRDGYRNTCKSCINAYNLTPEGQLKIRKGKLRWNYKMTLEQYDEKFEAQGGMCAICNQPESATVNGAVLRLAVDHDHRCCPGERSCGECIRGLLCGNCNRGLGGFRDTAEYLVAAVIYLEGYGA